MGLLSVGLLLLSSALYAADPPTNRVGVTGRFEYITLPGSELEVKPITDRKAKVVLRIATSYKHGTAYRYYLEYYGLEPGRYDLKDLLQRKDGSSTADVPSLPVTITSALPPGHVLPHDPKTGGGPSLGGYLKAAIVAIGLWLLGLIAIIFVGRGKRAAARAAAARQPTLADRLRPLVERGARGDLSPPERADLERSLMAYWRTRLGYTKMKPAEAMAALKAHADAAPLLTQLETWLHKPGPTDNVDVAGLLRPYQNMPADALDVPTAQLVTTS